jgi:uncharacterized protein (DUF2141 family)
MKTQLIAIAMLLASLSAFKEEDKGTLKVSLSNIKETGKIHVAVYRSGEDFPNQKLKVKSLLGEGINGKCELSFDEIPFGVYAIAVYQDVNGNGQLDKGMFGIPDEPFAFSNNFRPRFGGPSFEKCKFDFNKNDQVIRIEMINSLFGGD